MRSFCATAINGHVTRQQTPTRNSSVRCDHVTEPKGV